MFSLALMNERIVISCGIKEAQGLADCFKKLIELSFSWRLKLVSGEVFALSSD